jgi:protocatechuate 3,4-dioxygenase beta subunit
MRQSKTLRVWTAILLAACGSDTGPAATVASVTVSPAASPVAAGSTIQLTATPKDANGVALTGRPVTWSTNAPAIATVDANGLVSGKSPGTATITATSEGKGGSTNVTVTPGAPVRLAFSVQPPATVVAGAVIPTVRVIAQDALGNTATAFGGAVSVALGVNPAGGTLAGTKIITAVAGVAGFGNLSIDKAAAGYTLAATAASLTGATSTAFSIIPGGVSATQSTLVAVPASLAASSGSSSAAITVTARDANGNPIAGAAVVLAATGSGNTVTQPAGTTNAGGVAGGTISSTVAEAKILSATIAGVAITQQDTVTVEAGAAAALAFAVQPANATAGVPISPAIQVEAQDAFGNLDTAFTGTVTIAIGTNPSGGALSGTLTHAAVAGVATFNDLTIDKAGIGYDLQASAASLTTATSNAFDIAAGAVSATLSSVTAAPSAITASSGSSAAIVTVTARDGDGNPVPGATVVVAATGTGNTLTQPGPTDAAGVATATLSSTGAGAKVVSATISGVTVTETDTVTANAAAATKLDFTVQPSNTASGATISPVIQVTAEDAFGNPNTGFTGSVAIALSTNPNGATLSGTVTRPAVAGVAGFDDLSIDKAGTGYVLQASTTGLTAGTSSAFNILTGSISASQSSVVAAPATITASNGSSAATVTVRARDASGNPVPGATVVLAATGAGNSLTQPAGPTDAAGVATGTLSSTGAGAKVVSATIDGVLVTQTDTVTVSAGAATALAFTVQPTGPAAGASISPAIEVSAQDAFNNLNSAFTGNVTIIISTNPNGGTLSGTLTRAAVAGIASFDDISIDKAGTGYALQASGGGLTAGTSAAFNVLTGAISGSQSSLAAAPATITASGGSSTANITVTARDGSGNLLAGATVVLAATGTGNTLTQPVGTTNGAGVATGTLSSTAAGVKIVSATISGVAVTQTDTVTVNAGSAAALSFTVQPSNATAGATISPSIKVAAQDAFGNPDTTYTGSVTVAISTNPNGGTLAGTKIRSAVAGVATFNDLSIDKAGTGYVLQATATGLTVGTSSAFNITAAGVSASQSSLVTSPGTITASSGSSAATITVTARDAFGNLVSGAAVVLAATGSGNALTQPSGPTDVAGVATGTLSSTAVGAKVISATAEGVSVTQTDTVTVNAGAAAALTFTVQPSNATAGASITPAIQVAAQDAFGNPNTAFTGNVTMAIATNPSGGTLSGFVTRAAVAGVATFSSLSMDKSGTGYTLQASATGLTTAISTGFNVTAGSADHLGFLAQPTDVVAGETLATVQVEIQDVLGNRVTGATNQVTVAIFDNPNGGTLSGTKTVNAAAGVATFSTLSIDVAGSGYTLSAAAAVLSGTMSDEFSVSPGTASKLSFFVEPSDLTAGDVITPAVQVEVQDAFGNRVPTATNNITLALSANPGGSTFGGDRTVRAVAGVAAFLDLTLNKTGSGYRIRASTSSLTPDTSVTFDVTAGVASQLVFTVAPSSTAATATITPAVEVTARDAQGNTDLTFSGSVHVAIANNAGGGTLSGDVDVTAVNGVVAFSTLSIDRSGTGYTLAATTFGVNGDTTTAFNITVGAPTTLSFLVQPGTTSGGAAINPAVQVEILDAGGNRVTSATNTVTLAIADNPGGGTLSGATSHAAVSGVATFTGVSIDKAGTGYTLAASATGLSGATSSSFDITVGGATRLGFAFQPSNTSGGAVIAPAVQVEVLDAGGNRVTGGSHSISVVIGNNPGSGTLSGTSPITSANGVATFSDLSINNAGSGYTLSATSTGLTAATSLGFDIIIGTATKLAFFAQPSSTTGGMVINPAVQVEIQDAGGNRVSSATNGVTIGIGTNPNGGALSGTKTVAAVAGLATFSTLSIDSAANGYMLAATAGGLTGATSGSFNVTVGPAVRLGFRVQPTNTAGGATITPGVQVEVRDAGGNRVTSATNSITVDLATNANDGTLSGTLTVAAASGVAAFGTLSIDSAGTGYRLGASTAGLTDATSNVFNVTVGAAAKLGFLVEPSDATAGDSITPAIKVEVRDAGGNRVTTATNSVTMAIGSNPGGSTLSGTNPKAAVLGVATFSNLFLNKAAAGYTLQATSGGLTPVTSAAFAIGADGEDATLSSVIGATDTIGQCAFSCTPGFHASTVTVTVKDQFGNLVPGSPVVLSANGTGNAFSPSATGNTDVNGVFTAAFNADVVEAKTISATAGGTPVIQTAASVVMPALVGAGDIADCNSVRDDATANQLDSIPGVLFAAGDLAYPNGTATNFTNCYGPTWGRHKARTRPVVGNHEYDSSSTAAPYIAYFGAATADPLGNGFGYYSFDVGSWHVVVLNSDSGVTNPASGQLTWLQSDLVGRTNQCVLAIWHRALFTSGSSGGGSTRIRRLWQALENAGAEVVINGHDHLYERFAPQDSLGNATSVGIREFIVGTGGGETHSNYVNNPANVEASDNGNFSRGVMRLILYPNKYRWEFLPAQGQGTYTDSGTSDCH